MQSTNIGAPSTILIGPGAHRYLFNMVPHGTPTRARRSITAKSTNGSWDGRVLGQFPAGKLLKEFGAVQEIDSRNPDKAYVGEGDQLEGRAHAALD